RLLHADLRILADTAVAIPALTELLRERIGGQTDLAGRIARRSKDTADKHHAARAKWQEQARRDWDASPMTAPRLASEIWEVIQHEDWVLTANTLEDWTRNLWDFDKPY